MEPLSIVTPTFNEVETIRVVIHEIPAAYRFDIIFANSGSTDSAPRIAPAPGMRAVDAGPGYGRACGLVTQKVGHFPTPGCATVAANRPRAILPSRIRLQFR
jgi:hypothetical protein